MKYIRIYIVAAVFAVLSVSCGVSGDPGHCYISIDWEYYYPGYGVYYYEDDNPDIPDLAYIEPNLYYDSYPGVYEYYYESEDDEYEYYYTGVYTLVQNPGTEGGLFQDGMDGADTFFDLYLEIYAKKGLQLKAGTHAHPEADTPDHPEGGTEAVKTFGLKVSPSSGTASPSSGTASLSSGSVSPSSGTVSPSSGTANPSPGKQPMDVHTHSWEKTSGVWTLRVEETVEIFSKHH